MHIRNTFIFLLVSTIMMSLGLAVLFPLPAVAWEEKAESKSIDLWGVKPDPKLIRVDDEVYISYLPNIMLQKVLREEIDCEVTLKSPISNTAKESKPVIEFSYKSKTEVVKNYTVTIEMVIEKEGWWSKHLEFSGVAYVRQHGHWLDRHSSLWSTKREILCAPTTTTVKIDPEIPVPAGKAYLFILRLGQLAKVKGDSYN